MELNPGKLARRCRALALGSLVVLGTSLRAQYPVQLPSPPSMIPQYQARTPQGTVMVSNGSVPIAANNVQLPPQQPAGAPSAAEPYPTTTQPSPPEGVEKGGDGPAVLMLDGKPLVLNAAAAPAPAPAPLPNLPPPAGMGGFPSAPQPSDQLSSLEQFIRDKLSVKLRDGGTLRFYGFLRGDLDVATNRFNDIENPFFVLPSNGTFRTGPNNVPIIGNNPNYSLYPRLTRFGLEYYGQPIDCLGGIVPSGRLETDFLTVNPDPAIPGNFNSESRQVIRIRLAYAQMQYEGLTFLIGQDWDLIAPLLPTINDNTLMWNAGNLGDRRPQIKLLYDWHLTDCTTVQIQNAAWLADAIDNNDLDGNGLRDSQDRVAPGWQGRLGLIRDSWVPNQKIICGVWGAYGANRLQIPIGMAGRNHFNCEVVGLDLRLPIMNGLTFQGECYTGQDLDDLRGGSTQGINPFLGREVHASGGWCELVARPFRYYQPAVGVTTDNPVNGDVRGITMGVNQNAGITSQLTWYVSNRFPLSRSLLIGSDYLNWATDWQNYGRAHASLYKFFVQVNF